MQRGSFEYWNSLHDWGDSGSSLGSASSAWLWPWNSQASDNWEYSGVHTGMNSCPLPGSWRGGRIAYGSDADVGLQENFQTPGRRRRDTRAVNLIGKKGTYHKENIWKVSAEAVVPKITARLSAIVNHYFRKTSWTASTSGPGTNSCTVCSIKGSSDTFPLFPLENWTEHASEEFTI